MWFRVVVLTMAGILLAKAAVALTIPGRFYAERQKQYESSSPPGKVLIGPAVIIGLAVVSWYATVFHYEPWGWIVAAFLTAFAGAAVYQLLRWETHRHRMRAVVTNPKVWRIDCLLLAVGALFVTLAFLVY